MDASYEATPIHISSFSHYAPGAELNRYGSWNPVTSPASQNWNAANEAMYIPMCIPWPYILRRFWWFNGATVTGQVSMALLTENGESRLCTTGAVAQSGASAMQYAALTDGDANHNKLIMPGYYYMAISFNGTTGLVWATLSATVQALRIAGILKQATAHPIPTSMTGVAPTVALYPVCGFTKSASGF